MDSFHYLHGEIFAEDVALSRIAADIGTPFYCYSSATLTRHYTVFSEAFKDTKALICFAVKANSNLAVLRLLGQLGSGGDCVSGGEIRRCLAAGIPAERIVFSGVGKTVEEMYFALNAGIHQFNVESEAELELLHEVALSLNTRAPIAIRVNPDVNASTHDKISTGRKEDKFGVAWEQVEDIYQKAAKLAGIQVRGVSCHIGSQLTSLSPFRTAFKKVVKLVEQLSEKGHAIERLDLGGGLGIPYTGESPPHPDDYAEMVKDMTAHLNCELIFEPGRLIAGNAGVMVTKILYEKKSPARHFLIVDAAMNDLMRPALYDSYHTILPVKEHKNDLLHPVDVVGPVCETTDVFAKQRPLPISLEPDDLLVFRTAGAYGAVMSNNYNTRPLIPEVLVKDDDYAIIRKRETYEEMLAKDNIPDWL
jgi:diaminopimelate decarboxylase